MQHNLLVFHLLLQFHPDIVRQLIVCLTQFSVCQVSQECMGNEKLRERVLRSGYQNRGFHGEATQIKTKQNKIKETFPTGGTSYLENIIFKLGIKVSFAGWWITRQGSKKLFGKPSSHSPSCVCSASAAAPPVRTRVPRCCFHLGEAGRARR